MINIRDLAKQTTREDFLNCIYDDHKGDKGENSCLHLADSCTTCPSIIGLEDSKTCDESCYDCWKRATEHLEFKSPEPSQKYLYKIVTEHHHKCGRANKIEYLIEDNILTVVIDNETLVVPVRELQYFITEVC